MRLLTVFAIFVATLLSSSVALLVSAGGSISFAQVGSTLEKRTPAPAGNLLCEFWIEATAQYHLMPGHAGTADSELGSGSDNGNGNRAGNGNTAKNNGSSSGTNNGKPPSRRVRAASELNRQWQRKKK